MAHFSYLFIPVTDVYLHAQVLTSHYWAPFFFDWELDLIKTSLYCNAERPEILRPVISEKCGGNPFYINAVVERSAKLNEPLNDEEAINRILAIDLSSGFIYQELRDQVIKWIDRLNDHNITKWGERERAMSFGTYNLLIIIAVMTVFGVKENKFLFLYMPETEYPKYS